MSSPLGKRGQPDPIPSTSLEKKRSVGKPYRLLVHSLKQVVCTPPGSSSSSYRVGKALSNVYVIKNGAVVVGCDGQFVDVGDSKSLCLKYKVDVSSRQPHPDFDRVVDGAQYCALPGFVDAHTHACFAGDRVGEFAGKLRGESYMSIHKKGGGINFTVGCVRKASVESLTDSLVERLLRMVAQGTVVVEVKSGYGLSLEAEVKMLRAIKAAAEQLRPYLDVVTTYCGAHSVPRDSDVDTYTNEVVSKQIPQIRKLQKEGKVNVDMIDVFCEKGVFGPNHTSSILKAGQEVGWAANFHGDEIHCTHSGELGAELGVSCISHLERVTDQGIKDMAEAKVGAVLLPTTAYVLRLEPPPARKMIESNVPVCLGSDYNPNAHCLSMPMVMNLSCVLMKMSMEEALNAATVNSACALQVQDQHGSIDVGKMGDLVLLKADSWHHLMYQMADPPIDLVVKRGRVVFQHGMGIVKDL